MKRLFLLAACVMILGACAGVSNMENGAQGMIPGDREDAFKPGPRFSEQMREKIAAEYWALEGKSRELPVTLNDEVRTAVEYFMTDGRKFMAHALARSGRYRDMMQGILREKGLPTDLFWLVLIESGFRVDAVSPAAAAGPWQFIAPTGRRYGLIINDWVDERMNPEKATAAAADYLKDLYGMFGSWNLATAAYNCGEGKIQRGIKKYETDDFWNLASEDNFLANETKQYVPKFLAAVVIAKNPEGFGFSGIQYDAPESFDEVIVPQPTDLEVIGRMVGSGEDTIKRMNPQIRLWCTPLGQMDYPVRVPKGSGLGFAQNFARLTPEDRMRVSVHTVGDRETLNTIAAIYQLSPKTLQEYNRLSSPRVRKGQKLRLPLDPAKYMARLQEYRARQADREKASEKKGGRIVHVIRKGDTPFRIATQYDVDWKDIAAWNKIKDVRSLKVGDRLVLYVETNGNGAARKDRRTDDKTASTAKADPGKAKSSTDRTSRAAASLDEPIPSEPTRTRSGSPAAATTYTVQSGDTLWKIASNTGVNPERIKALNRLQTSVLRPGTVLKLTLDTHGRADEDDRALEAEAPAARTDRSGPGTAANKTTANPARPPRTAASDAGDAPSKRRSSGTYTVLASDTLWRIAQANGVSPEALRTANGLKSDVLRAGQVLKIPAEGNPAEAPGQRTETAAPAGPTKTPEPALTAADKKNKGRESAVRTADAKPTRVADTAAVNPKAYTVQNGDTLWKIARRFNVKPDQIKDWNKLGGDNLRPGTILTIRANPS